ncbi:MAG TPA: L-histidine N(alpha)-methyltransferase [Candidatus Saccharimonadia bacterium]|nr:L-histidine N(alpha)-methyltransferase [Candidatus Saccharimonadia bacterium]
MRRAAHDGLSRKPKALPPWLFYDERGSRLFESITHQPEYYPTRCELAILREHGRAIAEVLGENCCLIELGSGSTSKVRRLLRVLRRPEGYVAIDVSASQLREAVTELSRDYPGIPMTGIVADFSELGLPVDTGAGRRVAFFPGSTIGNMEPVRALEFLRAWRGHLDGGGMLVGVDLVKDPAVLHAAYNDSAGVTAAFNRNVLVRLNRELGARFEPRCFAHRAFWAARHSRVEMHLQSMLAQRVRCGDEAFAFEAGETIHTESSCKYTLDGFASLARAAGFAPREVWTDERQWFSLHFLAA